MSEQTYAPDYSQGAPWEPIWAMFRETARRQEETERIHKETEQIHKETEQILKEVARRQEETARRQEETDRQMKNLGKQMGELGHKLGNVVEHMVAPNLVEKFNALGFAFTKYGPNIKILDKSGNLAAEVDVLLENGDCAVAVEVKTQPNANDVKEHVKRMNFLRRYADERQDVRKFYGAVAGAVMDEKVREFILKKGLYAIEQSGDTMRVSVPKAPGPKAW